MTDSAARLVERIRRIDWDSDGSRMRSRVELMREYLRRSALWSQELGATGWPFFDAAAFLDPSVHPEHDLADAISTDPDVIENGPLVRDTCLWSLRMAAVRSSGVRLPGLPDMFEPLILMYERGGGFSVSSTKTIDVDGVGLPRWVPRQRAGGERKVPMDHDALDMIDSL